MYTSRPIKPTEQLVSLVRARLGLGLAAGPHMDTHRASSHSRHSHMLDNHSHKRGSYNRKLGSHIRNLVSRNRRKGSHNHPRAHRPKVRHPSCHCPNSRATTTPERR